MNCVRCDHDIDEHRPVIGYGGQQRDVCKAGQCDCEAFTVLLAKPPAEILNAAR